MSNVQNLELQAIATSAGVSGGGGGGGSSSLTEINSKITGGTSSSGAWSDLTSISLPAGTYLITGMSVVASSTSSQNDYLAITKYPGNDATSIVYGQNAVYSARVSGSFPNECTVATFKIVVPSTETWYLKSTGDNGGSNSNIGATISAVKIDGIGAGTVKMSARAYKTSDTAYGSGESALTNNSNWAKSDPQNIFTLSSSSFTIPATFTGTVRVKVTQLLGITSATTVTNWRKLTPIVRRTFPSALLVAIGTDISDASIVSGQPASGTSGSPFFQGTSSFEASPNDVFAISFYTNQAITSDSQGFQNWVLVELEQL